LKSKILPVISRRITQYYNKTGQGIENSTGALAVNTGEYTGRSPQDRFIVKHQLSDKVWWVKCIRLNLLLLKTLQ
jgi:ATP-dependent phosphoenolpyruvate carboxykinase